MTGQTQVPSGLLIVDKPGGITSHGVVAQTRRRLGIRKVGHAGTLDPMATGLMVLGVGRATRLLGHLALADKTYDATIRLGVSTVTDDAEGDATATPGATGVSASRISDAVAGFVGEISQVPSAVSAIKVAGKRAYALVRRGEEVELEPRTVNVSRFDVLDVRPSIQDDVDVVDVDVSIDCSTGTYVRALARDLGAELGTGGHLTALRRTRVGNFTLDQASDELIPLDAAARACFPVVELTDAEYADAVHGRPVAVQIESEPTALLHGDTLVGLYRPDGEMARPIAVLVPPR